MELICKRMIYSPRITRICTKKLVIIRGQKKLSANEGYTKRNNSKNKSPTEIQFAAAHTAHCAK
jgi:hypothetical protein